MCEAMPGAPAPWASAMNLMEDVVSALLLQTMSQPHSHIVTAYRPNSEGPSARAIHTLTSRPSAYSMYVDNETIVTLRNTAIRRFMARPAWLRSDLHRCLAAGGSAIAPRRCRGCSS